MKTLVVYQSNTGFTKQYAEWIANECNCQAVELKKLSANVLNQADRVIFGGWVMGSMIMGLGKLRKMNPKQLIVFAVGFTKSSDTVTETVKNQNQLGDTPFFYMEGGSHYNKLNFIQKGMLKMVKGSIAKKEAKTEEDLFMEKSLGTNFDLSDKKFIQPLLEYIKTA